MGRFSSNSEMWTDCSNSSLVIGDMTDQYVQATLLWCASRLQTAEQFSHHPELMVHNHKKLSEWVKLFDEELKERKSKVEKALEELKTREEKKETLLKHYLSSLKI